MLITHEEKKVLAQHNFEDCVKRAWYNVCPINDFCKLVTGEPIYQNKDIAKTYDELSHFNCVNYSNLPKETYVKLIITTKNIFESLGYIVDASKFLNKTI